MQIFGVYTRSVYHGKCSNGEFEREGASKRNHLRDLKPELKKVESRNTTLPARAQARLLLSFPQPSRYRYLPQPAKDL